MSGLTKTEFVSTVCGIIGDAHWAESAEKLFKKCAGDQVGIIHQTYFRF